MRGHGRDAEPVLVHAGLDIFRAHRGRSHLLSAGCAGRDAAAHGGRHARRVAFAKWEDQRERGAQSSPNETCCNRRSVPGISSSRRKWARSTSNRTTAFYSARTASSMASTMNCSSTISARRSPMEKAPRKASSKPRRSLVEAAVQASGRDNTTALVIDIAKS